VTRFVVALCFVGCSGGGDAEDKGVTDTDTDTDADADSDTDTDADTDADTDTDTDPLEDSVAVTCAPTDNALRFTCAVTASPPQAATLVATPVASAAAVRRWTDGASVADHAFEVVFLSPQTEYQVEATAGTASATTSFTTGEPPSNVAASLDLTGTSSTRFLGTNLPCTPNAAVAAVFDTVTGDMVWYQLLQNSGSLAGFNMLHFSEDQTVLGITGSNVVEVDKMGADLLRRPYDEDYNHDLFRRDGLTYIIYSDSTGRGSLQGVVVWDLAGVEVARFFMDEWPQMPPNPSGDWSHANSVWVDGAGQGFLSLYTQNTVVKFDADPTSAGFGEVEWVLAGEEPAGLGNDFEWDWSRIGGANGFERQHNVSVRSDGALTMLDNASGRGLVVEVDEVNQTAIAIEAYDTGNPSCGPQGTTTETAAGGMVVGCSGMRVREYAAATTTPAWTATLQCVTPPAGGAQLGANRWFALEPW
jgi:hypothetical protein